MANDAMMAPVVPGGVKPAAPELHPPAPKYNGYAVSDWYPAGSWTLNVRPVKFVLPRTEVPPGANSGAMQSRGQLPVLALHPVQTGMVNFC
jgi:hypothetical protein